MFAAAASSRGVNISACSGDTPLHVPPGAAITSTVSITNHITVNELQVSLHVLHPSVSNLVVRLEAPDQTMVDLWRLEGGNNSNLGSGCIPQPDFNVNETSGSPSLAGPYIGTYQSYEVRFAISAGLQQFVDRDAFGTWTLHVATTPAAGGDLQCWCLEVDGDSRSSKAIILAGGPPGSASWPQVDRITRLAYRTLNTRRGFSHDDIYYLGPTNPVMIGTQNVFDAFATLSNLESAIISWAADAEDLTVFLAGEGTNDTLRVNAGELLTVNGVYDLNEWLDTGQQSGQAVNLVLEFSGSGAFLPELEPPGDRQRVSVATSKAGRRSVLAQQVSFSDFLFSSLHSGQTLGEAIRFARLAIRRASGNVRQKVLLDDNGNGTPNEKLLDGLLADSVVIGTPPSQAENPVIGEILPSTTLSNTSSLLIFADQVSDDDGIVSSVWVEITPPTNDIDAVTVRMDLVNVAGQARWEREYADFVRGGLYTVTYYAQDGFGNISADVQSYVLKTNERFVVTDPGEPDLFEPDNTVSNALYQDLPVGRYFTLHSSNDTDWVRFYAVSNALYDVETVQLGSSPGADSVIEIFREEAGGALTPIEVVDEFEFEQGELTGLDFPEEGFYLVKVRRAAGGGAAPRPGSGVSGMSAMSSGSSGGGGFLLNIYVPLGLPGINVVVLETVAQAALTGAVVVVRYPDGTSLGTQYVGPGGLVNFPYPPDSYMVEVDPPWNPPVFTGLYVSIFHPTDEQEQASNPDSDYGTPRRIDASDFGKISYGGVTLFYTTFLGFYFHPVAIADGQVVDFDTGYPVPNAILQAVRHSDSAVFNRFPWSTYGDYWYTGGDGNFSNNLYLLTDGDSYTPFVQKQGYINHTGAVIATPSTGLQIDLGTVVLQALDVNTNNIPDYWEYEHFTNLLPALEETLDHDQDRETAYEEYIAGTDPWDPASAFNIPAVADNEDGVEITWTVEDYRKYKVHGFDPLTGTLNPMTGWNSPPPSATTMDWTNMSPSADEEIYTIEVRFP
jgi:hypothetical protein